LVAGWRRTKTPIFNVASILGIGTLQGRKRIWRLAESMGQLMAKCNYFKSKSNIFGLIETSFKDNFDQIFIKSCHARNG
jgi:hypothetical protein